MENDDKDEAPEFIDISLTADQAKGFIERLQLDLEQSQLEAKMLRNQVEKYKKEKL